MYDDYSKVAKKGRKVLEKARKREERQKGMTEEEKYLDTLMNED